MASFTSSDRRSQNWFLRDFDFAIVPNAISFRSSHAVCAAAGYAISAHAKCGSSAAAPCDGSMRRHTVSAVLAAVALCHNHSDWPGYDNRECSAARGAALSTERARRCLEQEKDKDAGNPRRPKEDLREGTRRSFVRTGRAAIGKGREPFPDAIRAVANLGQFVGDPAPLGPFVWMQAAAWHRGTIAVSRR
jgi:hypothetical protein